MGKDRIYRWWHLEHWFYLHHLRPLAIITRAFIRLVFSCDIPYQVKVGKGTVFPHDGLGMILHNNVEIGQNCKILHGVTMGGNGSGRGVPKVGNHVIIGAHAILLGGVIIGDGAVVGAGAVVTKDVPENAVVAGNPAKILRYKEENV